MATARQRRGRRTNVVVADWLREHGWPDAEPTYGSEPGRDVQKIQGHSIEIKARANLDLRAWLKQADSYADGDRACVVIRLNGQGEQSVGEYLVIRRLEDDELNKGRT